MFIATPVFSGGLKVHIRDKKLSWKAVQRKKKRAQRDGWKKAAGAELVNGRAVLGAMR
jgi:hypothetical protein